MAQENKLYTFNDMQRQCFFAQMKKNVFNAQRKIGIWKKAFRI
jgi:hypothetical protein